MKKKTTKTKKSPEQAKQTRKSSQESADFYRAIVEDQIELICRWQQGEILTFVNDAYCRFFGKSREELLGQSFMELIPKEDWKKVEEHFSSLTPKNPVSTHEHRVIAADGQIRWQQWSNRAIFNKMGRLIEFQSVGRDITNTKEALRTFETNYREIFNSVNDAVVVHDVETGEILDANQKAQEIFGYTNEELQQLDVVMVSSGETPYRQEDALHLIRKAAEGQPQLFDWQAKNKNGRLFWVEVNLKSAVIGGKKRVLAVVRDITERKRHEDVYLRDRAMAAATNGIIITDHRQEDEPIIYVNPAFTYITGYTLEEVIGKNCRFLQGKDREQPELNEIRRAIRQEGDCKVTLRNYRKDGAMFWNELTISPVRDKDGQLTHFVAIISDITDRKRAEKALKESEQRFRAIADYTYGWENWFDCDGRLLWINPGVERVTGYTVQECMSMKDYPLSLVYKDDYEMMAENLDGASKCTSGNIEFRVRRKDRKVSWVAMAWQPIYSDDGLRLGYRSSLRDITEIKQTARALLESEEKYRNLYETALIGLYRSSIENGRILMANQAFADILGYDSADQVLGVSALLKHYPDPERRKELLKQLRKKGKVDGFEIAAIRRDGTPVDLAMSAAIYPEEGYLEGAVVDITKRKYAEEQLRKSEEKYRLLFDCNPHPMWVYDLETLKFLAVNDAAIKSYGYSRKKFLAMNIKDIRPPEDIPALLKSISAIKPGVNFGGVWRHRKKDGTIFFAETIAHTLVFEGKQAQIVLSIDITDRKHAQEELQKARDELEMKVEKRTAELRLANEQLTKEITEHKHTEETLRDSEALYYSLVENLPQNIFRKNLEGKFTFANRRFCETSGKTLNELIGKTDFDLYPDELAKKYRKDDEEVLKTEQILDIVEEHQLPDGNRIYVQVIKTPLYDSAHKTIGTQCIFWDITDRKLAEEVLKKAKDQLAIRVRERTAKLRNANEQLKREIADRKRGEEEIAKLAKFPGQNPYPVLRISEDGKIIYGNKASEPLLKIWQSKNDKPPLGYLHRFVIDALQSGQNQQADIKCQNRFYSLTFAPVVESNYVNIYAFDITTRKEAEATLDKLNLELAAKNKELESILYVASHDLRSPLINIEGFSYELLRSCNLVRSSLESMDVTKEIGKHVQDALAKDIPEALGFISTSATKMDSLLAGLLRLSRLGRVTMKIEPLDMNALLANVVGSMEYQAKEEGATIKIGPLPPCLGDSPQINQVFSNLLDNALKYLDDSRPGLIYIRGKVENGRSVYCVEDNGIGIAQNHQEKIFETFHRLEPDKKSGEGLGLTIVRRILDRHNGRIWVESEPGKGSKFYVSLPTV